MPGSLVGGEGPSWPHADAPEVPGAWCPPRAFLGLLPWPERIQVARALRTETVDEDANGVPDIYQRTPDPGT